MKKLFLTILTLSTLNAAEPAPTESDDLKFDYTFYEYDDFVRFRHFDHLKFAVNNANGFEKVFALQDFERALREYINNEYAFCHINYISLKETLDAKVKLENARKYLELKTDPLSMDNESMMKFVK